MEIWKDIAGYDGLYQVSNLGRIKSLLFCKEKVLKPVSNNKGYYQVNLKGKSCLVDRIVCTAFHPNPDNKPHVNHLDEDPTNNAEWNLAWATVSENQLYSRKRLGSDSYRATIDEPMVRRIFALTGNHTLTEISNRLGVSVSVIHKIKHGFAWNQVTGLPRKRYNLLQNQALSINQ